MYNYSAKNTQNSESKNLQQHLQKHVVKIEENRKENKEYTFVDKLE